jgi:hypothetical protein
MIFFFFFLFRPKVKDENTENDFPGGKEDDHDEY